jgi:hypothetical protein
LGTALQETSNDGETAYLTSTSGFLYSLRLTAPYSLTLVAASDGVVAFHGPAAIAGDRLFIGSRDGYYAILR